VILRDKAVHKYSFDPFFQFKLRGIEPAQSTTFDQNRRHSLCEVISGSNTSVPLPKFCRAVPSLIPPTRSRLGATGFPSLVALA
jgi:hypothetical protein